MSLKKRFFVFVVAVNLGRGKKSVRSGSDWIDVVVAVWGMVSAWFRKVWMGGAGTISDISSSSRSSSRFPRIGKPRSCSSRGRTARLASSSACGGWDRARFPRRLLIGQIKRQESNETGQTAADRFPLRNVNIPALDCPDWPSGALDVVPGEGR